MIDLLQSYAGWNEIEVNDKKQLAARRRADKVSGTRHKPTPEQMAIERAVRGNLLTGPLFAKLGEPLRTPKLMELLRHVAALCPRLIDDDYVPALYWLAQSVWVRELETWEPQGKGRTTAFRALCAHLLARYPTPVFLYNGFFEAEAERLTPVIAHLAAGGSLPGAIANGMLHVPLTRRMCHDVLQAPGDSSVLSAIRRVQVSNAGGGEALWRAWCRTRAGRALHTAPLERFWQSVIAWLATQDAIGPEQVGQVVDYLTERYRLHHEFSMKGRSPRAVLRLIDEWHTALARVAHADGRKFDACGVPAFVLERSVRLGSGAFVKRVWRIDEIRSGRELAEEGRRMRHCVYSYARLIERGACSIWSLTLDDGANVERRITLELYNRERRIVQARGRLNRPIEAEERRVIELWARENQLKVAV